MNTTDSDPGIRTTYLLGPASRRQLVAEPRKASQRLEWVCEVYGSMTREALPRLRREEWAWLLALLQGLDIRSVDHLPLLVEKAKRPGVPTKGVDALGVSSRLGGIKTAGLAGIWDLVRQAAGVAEDPVALAQWVDRELPADALQR